MAGAERTRQGSALVGAGSASTCPSFKPCLWSSRRSTTALGYHCHSSETDTVDNKKSGSPVLQMQFSSGTATRKNDQNDLLVFTPFHEPPNISDEHSKHYRRAQSPVITIFQDLLPTSIPTRKAAKDRSNIIFLTLNAQHHCDA